jgi:hypothetical protein
MGCNHMKKCKVATGTYPRRQPQIVSSDFVTIFVCERCGAMRIDSQNIYCYSKGKWSNYSQDNLERLKGR